MVEDVDKWIGELSSNDWWVREDAAQFLGESGDPRAIPHLLSALEDPSGSVQAEAMGALTRFGPEVLPAILTKLESEDPRARWCALRVVSRIANRQFERAEQARQWYSSTRGAAES